MTHHPDTKLVRQVEPRKDSVYTTFSWEMFVGNQITEKLLLIGDFLCLCISDVFVVKPDH